ncbi:MAG: nucleotidyltransferase domain-containing protein [Defluviitaleaceae bacterium]|nr:nucleotidyltransferase domain-containing protein [Defluviitaleaceae bacterium]
MKNYKLAAQKFIENCSFNDDIVAVFLAGSHAVGNADQFSDIDLYIALNDNCDWRERGNRLADGFHIEYFANPIRQIKQYIDSSYSNVAILEINMILNGIVLFNKDSTAEHLREYCIQKKSTNFPKLEEFQIKMGKYAVWDNFDELTRSKADNKADFAMQYYIFLQNIFVFYSRYICSPVPNYQKLYKWLTDDTYRKNYNLPQYNDEVFLELVLAGFDSSDMSVMFEQAEKIKDYVLEKTGGFDIYNFALKGPLDL